MVTCEEPYAPRGRLQIFNGRKPSFIFTALIRKAFTPFTSKTPLSSFRLPADEAISNTPIPNVPMYEESFRDEVNVYTALPGSTIPLLYASGRVVSSHGQGRAISPGVLLMEYIPIEIFENLPDPHSVPHFAYYELVEAVSSLGSYRVSQNATRQLPRSSSNNGPRRVLLIDFGLCILPFPDEPDDKWQEVVMCENDELELQRYMLKLGIERDEWRPDAVDVLYGPEMHKLRRK
ncbi:uncharacterized protein EDB91DRAFT_1084639 [Suillus paluster]|uniref:uncharacterized protein n=1 Tax=Suillus paluster TaxID=48578 RepID=UPI001B8842C2|nr:uncharacterized protein EDB91DRAFT_1084639 [Suillus paluster]KAG1732908.1 hypothetical protein EDB91DRAFT_1084639 [Suillus paluster]